MALALVCPIDRSPLHAEGEALRCPHGHSFPVVDGIPVLLRDDVAQTIGIAHASRAAADQRPARHSSLYLETLGISESEKKMAVALAEATSAIDPVASVLIGATNGLAYKHLIGRLATVPIPELRLPDGHGESLLDIGCSWGRWSIAAARKGYRVTALDPSLGALAAARRIARSMNLQIDFVCGDARFLPFADASFDKVFSYSVLQHFSREDACAALAETSRALAPGGVALIQMPNARGLRSLVQLARRGFAEGSGFEVRYWRVDELLRTFSATIGPTRASVHCFFGLGLEASDARLMTPPLRLLLRASDMMRRMASHVPPLLHVADSLYLESTKPQERRAARAASEDACAR